MPSARGIALWLLVLVGTTAWALDEAEIHARTMRVAGELRCLVCQNQTIADSNADLAADLRRQVREMIVAGRSDDEIVAFMTERYGDFVLYRPPLKASTALLWFGPGLLLLVGGGALWLTLRRRSTLPDEALEPDEREGDAPRSG